MKRILITGANSYIGTSFESYLKQWPDEYIVDTLDMRGEAWRQYDFAGYDTVLHVAGIAHTKETKQNAESYYKINRDLVVEAAQKAKSSGILQFIFLSSMSVYGIETSTITNNTATNPTSNYGKSKVQAEKLLGELEDNQFKISIVRPPMVYGPHCKGNYPRLSKLARVLPIFPDVNNRRSMIYIENLCEFIRLLVVNEESGIFWPQNAELVNTSDVVKMIAEAHGKHLHLTKLFNKIIVWMSYYVTVISKVFGNLSYDPSLSTYKSNYAVRDFKSSILLSENSCGKLK